MSGTNSEPRRTRLPEWIVRYHADHVRMVRALYPTIASDAHAIQMMIDRGGREMIRAGKQRAKAEMN